MGITWESSECPPESFDVDFALRIRDQCETVTDEVYVGRHSVNGPPVLIENIEEVSSYSTYTVRITGTGSLGVHVAKYIILLTQEAGMI